MSTLISTNKNTCFIYKNDLKFKTQIDVQTSEFESDSVKSIYNNFKNKPKIELRIEDSKIENYRYLDLSSLEIDDSYFDKLLELKKIINILTKIEFLDLSNNNISIMPNLSKFKNILYLNVSNNKLSSDIIVNNLIELTCSNNKIRSITSNKLTHLNASNNLITFVNIPNIQILIINKNNIICIKNYVNLKYLECIENSIEKLSDMEELEELYIGNNKLYELSNMPKLKILNCVKNPIEKIKFFPCLKSIMTSTPKISSQYILSSIEKIKSDFSINFISIDDQ